MTNTALITGASAGLGTEFARYHASKGGDVIITARRKEALDTLKNELEEKYGITAHVIAHDLGQIGGGKALYEAVKAIGAPVEILINNAGFGGHGKFVERELDADLSMIQLNVTELVTLTHLVAKDMVEQGGGKILNVGSTAGFAPGPNQATYFATKAFVNSFSQALNEELRGKGVTSTVLAPGYVETEFAKTANLEGTTMVKAGGANAADVAKFGYDAMMRGELISINERLLSFLMNWIIPLVPRRTALGIIARSQTKPA